MRATDDSALEADFINLLLRVGVLLRGHFRLKSGGTSPYFVDFGRFADPASLYELGVFYATKVMRDVGAESFDVLFGPAYKGVPIAIATSLALHKEFGVERRYAFNRKVPKDYGEEQVLLGDKLEGNERVLVLDDVITDGGTKYESIELLSRCSDAQIVGFLVGVDRSENPEVIRRFEHATKCPFWSIVTIADVERQTSDPAARAPSSTPT